MTAREWPFLEKMLIIDEIDSTNDHVKRLLPQGPMPLPLGVWARRQTLGRGQGENRWWSDEGSLSFTLAIDPRRHGLRLEQEPRLALMTAVAVIDAVAALGLIDPGIGIRWPNDVEVNGRKLGGILPERVETDRGHFVVIGLGFNLTTRLDHAPDAVQRMATSLSDLQPRPLPLDFAPRFLTAFLEQFASALARLSLNDPDLARRWDSLNLLRGQTVRVALGPNTLQGQVHAIDPEGALVIHDGHKLHHLFGGRVLRDAPAK